MIILYLHKRPKSLNLGELDKPNKYRDNESYHIFLKMLLESLNITNPNREVTLKLVNHTEEEINKFRTCHEKLIIEREDISYQEMGKYEYIYFWHMFRLKFFKEQLNKHGKIIHLDIDMIVREDIQEIYDILEEYDFTVIHRGARVPSWKKQNGGVYGFSGERALNYLEETEAAMKWKTKNGFSEGPGPTLPGGIFTLQRQLYLLCSSLMKENKLLYKRLPPKFNDPCVEEDSIIWHGNGSPKCDLIDKKFYLQKFSNELKKLRHVE